MINIDHHYSSRNIYSSGFKRRLPPSDAHEQPIILDTSFTNGYNHPISQIDLVVADAPRVNSGSTKLTLPLQGDDLSLDSYLSYLPSKGSAKLVQFSKNYTECLQNPPYPIDCVITSGNGDGLTKLLMLFLEPGDTVLMEEYSYPAVWGPVESLGGKVVGIPVDMSGPPVVDVDAMEKMLANWDESKKKPKLLYTVLTTNPFGLLQPLEIRKRVYELCRKYDILILEDDPDGNLTFQNIGTFETYTKERTNVSYINLDVDGRVFRMETFNKMLCGGLRLGFISGRQDAMAKVLAATDAFTKAASGLCQVIFLKFIERFGDGPEGYLKWSYEAAKEMKSRTDKLFAHLESSESFKKGLITPVKPDGGMFFIIKLNYINDHFEEQMVEVYNQCLRSGITINLGSDMLCTDQVKATSNFVRARITNLVTDELCELAAQRLDDAFLKHSSGTL